jgi:hypothetical protein
VQPLLKLALQNGSCSQASLPGLRNRVATALGLLDHQLYYVQCSGNFSDAVSFYIRSPTAVADSRVLLQQVQVSADFLQ